MSVPQTVKFKVEQAARDLVLWANGFETNAEKARVLVPRVGQFDDGDEIRANRPETPFVLVSNSGSAVRTGQDSIYVADQSGTTHHIAPYRSTVNVHGYGRPAADWLHRTDLLSERYDGDIVDFMPSSGIRDLSKLVENDETIEARYQLALTAMYMVDLEMPNESVPADKIEATINSQHLVEQTL